MILPERILIMAPHPDDEVLMAAGLIRQALETKRMIFVCIVTNGDHRHPNREKGSRRLAESLEALTLLGMAEKDIYFLGYPDTGFAPEVSFLHNLYHTDDPRQIFPSECGKETYGIIGGKQDFRFERDGRHSPYHKQAFLRDLDEIIAMTQPRLIVTASDWDVHGDHAALFHFTCDAVKRLPQDIRPAIWKSMVHSPAGDDKWPLPDAPHDNFTMPPGLEQLTDLRWNERIRLPLPESMLGRTLESHLKYQAIRAYRSALKVETEPEVVRYLLAFTKKEEIFWQVN